MFFGTTPQPVASYIVKTLKEINPSRVFVGCAGNFVVEQIARQTIPDCEIHSTDVSLYSCAVGWAITDQDFRLEIRDEDFSFLKDRMETPLEKAAVVIFLNEVAPMKNKKALYYQNLFSEATKCYQYYIPKIIEKLVELKENTKGMTYHAIDNMQMWDLCKEGDYVFYDPPVILKDYEKNFKVIGEVLSWDIVKFQELTDELKHKTIRLLSEKGVHVVYRTNNPIKDTQNLGLILRFHYQYRQDAAYCVYVNDGVLGSMVGRREQLKEKVTNLRIITKEMELTKKTKIKIIATQGAIANHYRLLWTRKANMTDMGVPYLVFADEALIGLFNLCSGLNYGVDRILILSDPCCPSSKYKRLSKLIIYIIATEEIVEMFNDKHMWEHSGFTTLVLSNNPSSMKYRGELFQQVKKEECQGGEFKYKLVYHSKQLNKTIKDGYSKWLQKHSTQLV